MAANNSPITLRNNSIYSALQNMVISQHTFSDPYGGLSSDIIDGNRVDGTLFGDTKDYISLGEIEVRPWKGDAEAANLLSLHRNTNIKHEQIICNVFKMIELTTGEVLEKQAWMNEGNFSQFTSAMLATIRDAKRVYEVTTYNTFVGTNARDTKQVTVAEGANEALVLADYIADVLDDMAEPNTTYNGFGFERAYGRGEVDIIFNKSYLNKWKYVDLPIVFHKDGILGDHKSMNQRYFGTTPASVDAAKAAVGATAPLRFAVHAVLGSTTYKAGDLVPNANLVAATTTGSNIGYKDTYIEDPKTVAIIVGKGAIPFMSTCESNTAFFNPAARVTTNYCIFGHNTLKALQEKPYVVIKKA